MEISMECYTSLKVCRKSHRALVVDDKRYDLLVTLSMYLKMLGKISSEDLTPPPSRCRNYILHAH